MSPRKSIDPGRTFSIDYPNDDHATAEALLDIAKSSSNAAHEVCGFVRLNGPDQMGRAVCEHNDGHSGDHGDGSVSWATAVHSVGDEVMGASE